MPIPQSILQPTPEPLLLDNLKTAVLVLDADLHVQYLNTAAETLLEASASRLRGAQFVSCFRRARASTCAAATSARRRSSPYTERTVKLMWSMA